MMNSHRAIPISDVSQIGEARREAQRISTALGFDEVCVGRVAIVVSELATNLSRYCPKGEILLQSVDASTGKRIDVTSIDRGPGMADMQKCLQDGYSKGGTSGNGLGAVKRASDAFDIYSSEPTGTVVFASISERQTVSPETTRITWGGISLAVANETRCGDSWSLCEHDGRFAIMIADGLGHGPLASDASQEACKVFDRSPFAQSLTILQEAHHQIRAMRGAAVSIAQSNSDNSSLKYAGIGNVSARLCSLGSTPAQGLVSINGTVGVQVNKPREFDYSCSDFPLLIMYSDGLQSRWSLDAYPGIASRHPGLIAGILYRDFHRAHDDVTVVVIRCRK